MAKREAPRRLCESSSASQLPRRPSNPRVRVGRYSWGIFTGPCNITRIVRTTGVPNFGGMSKRWLPTDALKASLIPVIALVASCASASPRPARSTPATTEDIMNATTQSMTKAKDSALDSTTLVARLKKAGEAEVLGADQAEIDSYFDTKQFRFHAPDG